MDCYPHVHVAALHADAPAGYQTATPGLGVLCRDGVWLAGVGVLQNSHGRTSEYVQVGAQPIELGPVRLGAIVGSITGYRAHAMPMAALVASVPVPVGELHFTVIPPVAGLIAGRKTPLTVALSVSVNWK